MVGNRFHDTDAFSLVLGRFQNATPRERFLRTHAKIYFLALRWRMPQFDGWEPISQHCRVFAYILPWFRKAAPRERFCAHMRKKIFLNIVVGNVPIWWLDTYFATPAHFRLRSRVVLKSCSTEVVFAHACEKIFLDIMVRW